MTVPDDWLVAHTEPPPQASCVGWSSRAIVVVRRADRVESHDCCGHTGLATHTAPAATHTPLGLLPIGTVLTT